MSRARLQLCTACTRHYLTRDPRPVCKECRSHEKRKAARAARKPA